MMPPLDVAKERKVWVIKDAQGHRLAECPTRITAELTALALTKAELAR